MYGQPQGSINRSCGQPLQRCFSFITSCASKNMNMVFVWFYENSGNNMTIMGNFFFTYRTNPFNIWIYRKTVGTTIYFHHTVWFPRDLRRPYLSVINSRIRRTTTTVPVANKTKISIGTLLIHF